MENDTTSTNDGGTGGKTPIHIPTLLYSNLNGTENRYERLVAAPSDRDKRIMWTIWMFLTASVALFVLVVFLALVVNKKIRKSPFNIYLLFLMVPDFFTSAMCALTCFLNLLDGKYHSARACNFQSFYLIFGIGSNTWLNAVVAREMHKMLRYSSVRRRYFPPSKSTVWRQSIGAFVGAAAIALLPLLSWFGVGLPLRTRLQSGIVCVPAEYSPASTLFFFLVFLPLFALVPVAYVLWVAVDIWHRGLIPSSARSRTRSLAVYFFRLIFVFCVIWLPSLIAIFIAGAWLPPWAQWAGGVWSHFQGAVSTAVSILKPDIRQAIVEFWTCRGCQQTVEETERALEPTNRRGSALYGFGGHYVRNYFAKNKHPAQETTSCSKGSANSSSNLNNANAGVIQAENTEKDRSCISIN